MARKPRIEFPGAFYHVIARGNNRQSIFHNKWDYIDFLNSLTLTQQHFPFTLFAYTLMTNHFHLLLQTPKAPLSQIMRSLLTRYSHSFNHRHRRLGHLFGSRYKAILCQKDAYLLELVRYIHLNPVRAGLVKSPSDWPWSSHLIYLGKNNNQMVNFREVLSSFSLNKHKARTSYAEFVRVGLVNRQKKHLYPPESFPILGDSPFLKQITHQQKELRRETIRPLRLSLSSLAEHLAKHLSIAPIRFWALDRDRKTSYARAVFCYCALEWGRHRVNQIADFLHVHSSSVRRAFNRGHQDAQEKPKIFQKLYQALSS